METTFAKDLSWIIAEAWIEGSMETTLAKEVNWIRAEVQHD